MRVLEIHTDIRVDSAVVETPGVVGIDVDPQAFSRDLSLVLHGCLVAVDGYAAVGMDSPCGLNLDSGTRTVGKNTISVHSVGHDITRDCNHAVVEGVIVDDAVTVC